jgi:hypothetical protein
VTDADVLGVWVGGALLSVVLLGLSLRRQVTRGVRATLTPHLSRLRALRGQATDHNLLNMALYLPRQALPLVVTAVLTTSATAGFYTAWMVVTVLAMVPSHLSTTLFALTAGDRAALRAKVRVVLIVALGTGVPVSVLISWHARLVMEIFGSGYAQSAAGVLSVLALSYVPTVIRQAYVGISRVLGRARRASALALCTGAAELIAAAVGAYRGGLMGLTYWLTAVIVVEALVMLPTVLGVILDRPAGDRPGHGDGAGSAGSAAEQGDRPGHVDGAGSAGSAAEQADRVGDEQVERGADQLRAEGGAVEPGAGVQDAVQLGERDAYRGRRRRVRRAGEPAVPAVAQPRQQPVRIEPVEVGHGQLGPGYRRGRHRASAR